MEQADNRHLWESLQGWFWLASLLSECSCDTHLTYPQHGLKDWFSLRSMFFAQALLNAQLGWAKFLIGPATATPLGARLLLGHSAQNCKCAR